MKIIMSIAIILLIITACNNDNNLYDASGSFEAEEIIIFSEAQGIIKQFDVNEGETLRSNQIIGYIDSMQLYLKKKQLEAQIVSLMNKKPDVALQLEPLYEQIKSAEKEQNRIDNLLKSNAATQKQFDDITTQIAVLKKQLEAQKSSLLIATNGIDNDIAVLQIQIKQIDDQLSKCKIINPVNGTLLIKYAEENEIATFGKPLYKIADLTNIILRVYVSGRQLSKVKINQKVKVLTDNISGDYNETEGTITWINDKAEFTPKTIQTKDERTNLVYAIKVKVANEGFFKIGMYGEIKF